MKALLIGLILISVTGISNFLQSQTVPTAKKLTINFSKGKSRYLRFGEVMRTEDREHINRKKGGDVQQLEVLYHLSEHRQLGILHSRTKHNSRIQDVDINIDWVIGAFFIPFPVVSSKTTITTVEDKSHSTTLIYKELLGRKGRQKVFWGTAGLGFWHIDRMAKVSSEGKTIKKLSGKKTLPQWLVGLEMQVPIFKHFDFGMKTHLVYASLTKKESPIAISLLPSIGVKF